MRLEMADGIFQRQGYEQYRKRLTELLAADMGVRAYPGLFTLPLTILNTNGQDAWLSEVLDSNQPVLLRGSAGSGRRLALIQLLDHWIAQATDTGRLPLPIDLAILDDGVASPNALLAALIAELGAIIGQWMLLISGWEELPIPRRIAWRTALIHGPLPRTTQVCVILAPTDEPAWPGLLTDTIPTPDTHEVNRWFGHLAPHIRPTVLHAAIYPNPTLLRCVLAVWSYEQGMLSASRSARERMGQTLVRQYVKRPSELPEAVGMGSDRFYTRRAELHTQAQQIIISGDYAEIINHPQREDITLLLAEITPEGDELLYTLYVHCRNDDQLLLLAGHVLLIRSTQSVALALLLLRALGRLAQTSGPNSEQASEILAQSSQNLNLLLAAAAKHKAFRLIRSVLLALPKELALSHLPVYAYAETTPESIGWQLTDQLIAFGEIDGPQPEAGVALSRWAFAHALDHDYGHELIMAGDPADILRALVATPPERKERAAAALLHNPALPTVVRMSSLSLLEGCNTVQSLQLAEQLFSDPTHEIRVAAIHFLNRIAPRRALRATADIACSTLSNSIREDSITALIGMHGRLAVIALYDCVLDQSLGIELRLQALSGLTNRHGGLKRLAAVALDPEMHESLRAIALHLLGLRPVAARHRSLRSVLPARILIEQQAPTLVTIAACAQLGKIGGARALQTLLRVIADNAANPDLTRSAIGALGQIRDDRAIPVLALLLGTTALTRLQQACPEELLRKPTADVLEIEGWSLGATHLDSRARGQEARELTDSAYTNSPTLPLDLMQSLRAAVATCLTVADRPSTTNEYLVLAADAHRRTAAKALASIGGEAACEALSMALITGDCGNAIAAICAALAETNGTEDTSALATALHHPDLSLRIRWVAAQELSNHASSEQAMIAGLCDITLDNFTRGELAEGLGKRQIDAAALPLIEIVREPTQDMYLRERALRGLALLGGTASELVLCKILSDSRETAQFRGLAASCISASMSAETRQQLRDQLRNTQADAAILVGILQALGQAHDQAMLPLMLEYLSDPRGDVVRAAIAAITAIADPTITPALIILSQHADADRTSRLYAIGALLKIADRDYSLLLRDYLNHPMLPVQLQALEQLIESGGDVSHLLLLLQDRERALPFRLRALEAAAGRISSAVPLAAMLHDSEEPPELRGRIAQLLAQIGGPTAHNLLAEIALRSNDHVGTRIACIVSLAARHEPDTASLLAQLVEATDEHSTIREQASLALVQLIAHDGGAV